MNEIVKQRSPEPQGVCILIDRFRNVLANSVTMLYFFKVFSNSFLYNESLAQIGFKETLKDHLKSLLKYPTDLNICIYTHMYTNI